LFSLSYCKNQPEYVKGLTKFTEVIGKMNLANYIEEAAGNFAERTALIADNQRISYEQLNKSVNAVAHLLQKMGITKGDKIALMLPNIPEFIYCYFAAVKIGAIALPLNTAATTYELSFLLENSDAKMLLAMEIARKRYEEIQVKLTTCRQIVTVDSADPNSPFKKALAAGPFHNPGIAIDPEDPAAIIYTSGLTGKPLGAVLTHRNLYSQSFLMSDVVKISKEDKGLSIIPLFHAFGATVNMIAFLRVGSSIVMMDRFTMDAIFNAIEKEKITYVAAVPRLYLGMMFHEGAAKYNVSSLNICVTGGAPMPPEFMPEFEKKFGVKILEGYGLTEASPCCSFNRIDMAHKPGSIGTVLPDVEIKIIDDKDKEVPRGQIGELIVRGDNVMKGYYKDEAATALVIKNGWLYTGDLGKMDEDDYIFLTGIKKRMIITSGFNVYPQEVENVLNLHPAVQDSRVVGKADLMRGEIVKADIVTKAGATIDDKEIMKHCRIYLSPYKVPREVEFVSELEEKA
jgi:long-chain acyl-CoA synthetase